MEHDTAVFPACAPGFCPVHAQTDVPDAPDFCPVHVPADDPDVPDFYPACAPAGGLAV